MFNNKQFPNFLAAIAVSVTISTVYSAAAQAATIHTTDFIPDVTRTNFNGFEGLPDSPSIDGPSGYVEDGIKVEQVNGQANGIWSTYLPSGFEGNRAWYPNGGDNGYTRITRANGNDFFNIGLLRGSGYGNSTTTYVYQLLKQGVSIISGTLFNNNTDSAYLGFSGGGFDEVRLGNYYGNNSNQTLSGLNALAIDSIELSNSTAQPVPTPALLPGLIGLGVGVLRKRKAEAVKQTSDV